MLRITRVISKEFRCQVSIFIYFINCSCCCSVDQSCTALCDTMDCSMPGFPVLRHLPEFAQIHVHWVNDAIQTSCPLSPTSPLALSLSQHQGLFQWISSSYQVAKDLELQLQYQSFQWIFRVDLLAVQGTLKSLLQHYSLKEPFFQHSAFFMIQLLHYMSLHLEYFFM